MAMAATLISKSNALPGEGYKALVTVVCSGTYSQGTETLDLSAIFPNEVYGGAVYGDTLNDGGWIFTYTRDTAGAPATGVVQAWYTNNDAGGAQDPLIEAAAMTDLTAVNGAVWCFWGR